MATVAICTPNSGVISPEYNRGVIQMQNNTPGHAFIHVEIGMQIVGKARNDLVKAALGAGAEVVWFVDCDTIIPPHAGVLVDQALQLGIVSVLYFSRRQPYTPQLYTRAIEPQYQGMEVYWPLLSYPEGLMVVDAAGAGCLAIRADIFKDLEDFSAKNVKRATELEQRLDGDFKWLIKYNGIRKRMSPWFEFMDYKGEDLYFCEVAREAGHIIWANTTVKCDHNATIPIGERHFKHLVENKLLHRISPDGQLVVEGA